MVNIFDCAILVIVDEASELKDLENEKIFYVTFKFGIKAFYGEGLSGNRSKKDIVIAKNIIASNVDKIYTQPEWTAEV